MPTPPDRDHRRAAPASRVEVSLPGDVTSEILQSSGPARGRDALRHADRAATLISERDPEGAVREALQAKRLAPRSASVREILALALYGAGEWGRAITEMQAYRRMSGRLDENHVIADCYRALGKPDRAVAEVESALAGDVDEEVRAEAAVVGAAALLDQGRNEQALALMHRLPKHAAGTRPFDLRVWYMTGDILARLGRREEAAREFLRIVRHDAAAFDAADRLAALA